MAPWALQGSGPRTFKGLGLLRAWARALAGPLGHCGPPWALVGQALMGPLGHCGLGPRGPALVGPLGPHGPSWAPALMGLEYIRGGFASKQPSPSHIYEFGITNIFQ